MMEKVNNSNDECKKQKSFPRILWLNRNWDLITVHKKVFNFLRFFFEWELLNFDQISEENAFFSIFKDLTEDNWRDKLGNGDESNDYTYTLNIRNPDKNSYDWKGIKNIDNNNYSSIPLPFTENSTIGEYIDNFLLEYDSGNQSQDYNPSILDNEASKKTKSIILRNNINDWYYHESDLSNGNYTVFELEVFWNKNMIQANLGRINTIQSHYVFDEICK